MENSAAVWVLGIETSTERTVVALGVRCGESVEVRQAAEIDAPRAALARALPSCVELLEREGVALRDVGEVLVGVGPGSFTGVRVGVATAKGLAHGLGAKLYSVSVHDAVAWTCAPAITRSVPRAGVLLGVVGDAMRKEVYPMLYRVTDGRVSRLERYRVERPERTASSWAALGERVIIAGTGCRKYADLFREALGSRVEVVEPDAWCPSAAGLLAAYAAARNSGEAGDGVVGTVLPVYTRLSDAEEAERACEGRR